MPLENQSLEVDKANQPKHDTLTLRQCDESKPVCRNCNRHTVSCIYENATKFSSKSPLQHSTSTERLHEEIDLLGDYRGASSSLVPFDLEAEFAQEMTYSSGIDEPNVLDDLESKSRRLLELRLLTNYIDRTSRTFGACHHDGNAFLALKPAIFLSFL